MGEACQFIIEELSKQYQPDRKDNQPRSDPRRIQAIQLLEELEKQFKESPVSAPERELNMEAMGHVADMLKKEEEQIRKERNADDERRAAQHPLEPGSTDTESREVQEEERQKQKD